MWPYIKAIFTDEGKFLGFFRAALMVGGLALDQGDAPAWLPEWVGMVLVGSAMLMRSSSSKAVAKEPTK